MRIVYVLTSLGIGGAERQVLALASRMAEHGHTVALLVLRPQIAEEWPTSLPVCHLDMRKNPVSLLAGMVRGCAFLRDLKPDLLHSHSFHANILARLLKLFLPSTCVISTVHNVYEGGWLRMLAYRLTDRLSLRTTAVSEAAAVRFVRLKAVPRQKCVVLMNGIDTAEFSPDADRRERTRGKMGVTDEFIWLAAGRIVPAKDYPNLLRAFGQVRTSCPDAQLWIAGEAPDAAVSLSIEGIREQVTEEGVRWLGLRRDMPALLDSVDGFVLASAWEGMPLALGEAMAMEKLIVATDVGGVRELAGKSGTIVPAKDADALSAAMVNLMGKAQADREALGREARLRIENKFSMENKAAEWEALYRVLLEQRN